MGSNYELDSSMSGIQIFDYLQDRLKSQEISATKYETLSDSLKQAMKDKILLPGSNLPSERKLAELLGVSRVTVRNSIDKLVLEGLLVRRQGARTFVAQKVGKQISNLIGFSEDMKSRGLTPGVNLISAQKTLATDLECEKLELELGEEVVRLRRVRLANDRPIALEIAVFPVSIVKSALDEMLFSTLRSRCIASTSGKPLRDNGCFRRVSLNLVNSFSTLEVRKSISTSTSRALISATILSK